MSENKPGQVMQGFEDLMSEEQDQVDYSDEALAISGEEPDEIFEGDDESAFDEDLDAEDTGDQPSSSKASIWSQYKWMFIGFGGVGALFIAGVFWLMSAMSSPDASGDVDYGIPPGPIDYQEPASDEPVVETTEPEPEPEPEPFPLDMPPSLTVEDVKTMIKPLVDSQIRLDEEVAQLKSEIAVLESNAQQAGLNEQDLSTIRAAINSGISQLEQNQAEIQDRQLARIVELESTLKKLTAKNDLGKPREMKLVSAVEGKATVIVIETGVQQMIVEGDLVRGRGRVEKIGPWGCMHFFGGEQYAPVNGRCVE